MFNCAFKLSCIRHPNVYNRNRGGVVKEITGIFGYVKSCRKTVCVKSLPNCYDTIRFFSQKRLVERPGPIALREKTVLNQQAVCYIKRVTYYGGARSFLTLFKSNGRGGGVAFLFIFNFNFMFFFARCSTTRPEGLTAGSLRSIRGSISDHIRCRVRVINSSLCLTINAGALLRFM